MSDTIFVLTLRQSLSIKRVAILLILAAIPLTIAIVSEILNVEWGGDEMQGFIQALIINTALPLVALIVAAPVFADEIEDRTLTNLMLSPIARWQVAIPKTLAALSVVVIPMAISTFASVIIIWQEDIYTSAIVGAFGILIGALAFTSLFAFVGTLTTRAVVFGIVYVFGFEALISSAIPGLKYISISGMTIAIMQELGPTLVDAPKSGSNAPPPVEFAIPAIIAIIIITNLGTIWRLKRMDVH